ncbi:unnamed protein product, partial [Laminaria digitata]
PPKFDNVPEHYAMWRSKFGAYISSLGHLHVLNATVPVMVGDISVSQEELANKHTKDENSEARLVYGLLVEAMTDYGMVQFRMQEAMSPSVAWKALEDFHMPKTVAAKHRLKKEFETIRMVEDEDPLLFLGRVDKAANQLAMLGCSKSIEEVNQHIVNNLSSLFMIQSKSILSRPNIPRAEIDEIIRDAYLHDKVEKEMLSKAMAVKGAVDPHALCAGGAQPADGGGAGSGGGGRHRTGGRFKG